MTAPPFLVLDGIDGTGKSTQCRLLVDWLVAHGVSARACADPGGTPIGDKLREILLGSREAISKRTETLLFMASRAELVAQVIRPALAAGQVVVCDRFVTSNVVYQGHAQDLPPEVLWSIGEFATGGLLPDLTVILDLPVAAALERRRRHADRIEERGLDYLGNVRKGFLREASERPERYRVVDATGDIAAVQDRVRAAVVPLLTARGLSIRTMS